MSTFHGEKKIPAGRGATTPPPFSLRRNKTTPANIWGWLRRPCPFLVDKKISVVLPFSPSVKKRLLTYGSSYAAHAPLQWTKKIPANIFPLDGKTTPANIWGRLCRPCSLLVNKKTPETQGGTSTQLFVFGGKTRLLLTYRGT